MRSLLNTIVLAAGLTASLIPAAIGADEPKGSASAPSCPTRSQTSVLDNGLTVISVPFDSPGIIAYYTVVRTGARNEVEKGLSASRISSST